jgi:NTE family protein
LKPAIALGADALVTVATSPLKEPAPADQSAPPAPDVDDMVVQLMDTVLIDRMVEDARTLCKLNNVIGADDGRGGYTKKPLLFVSPPSRATLGEKAMEVFRSQRLRGGDFVDMLRRSELWLLGRALAGDGARRGDLFSYLYFDREFIEESIALGRENAEDHFKRALPNEIPWTSK